MDNRIKKVMAAIFNVDISQIDENSSVETLSEWDSLKHMTLVVALEEEFNVEFDHAEYLNLTSLGNIRKALGEKLNPTGKTEQ